MGVDVEHNYDPKYITIRGKGPVLKELKTAAKKAKKYISRLTPTEKGRPLLGTLLRVLM